MVVETLVWIGLGLFALLFLTQYSKILRQRATFGSGGTGLDRISNTFQLMWQSIVVWWKHLAVLLAASAALLGLKGGIFWSIPAFITFDPNVWASVAAIGISIFGMQIDAITIYHAVAAIAGIYIFVVIARWSFRTYVGNLFRRR